MVFLFVLAAPTKRLSSWAGGLNPSHSSDKARSLTCEPQRNSMFYQQEKGVPLRHSGLRIQCCHCSSLGCCCHTGSISGLGTSTCHRCGPRKTKVAGRKVLSFTQGITCRIQSFLYRLH